MIDRAEIFGLVCLLFWIGMPVASTARGDLSFDGIALTPLSRVEPGKVLVLQVRVGNSAGSPSAATIVVSIDEFPKLQSARRVVLSAGQKNQFDLFVQIPESARNLKSLHITATMVDRSGDREVIVERNGTPARHTMTVSVGSGQTMALEMQPDPVPLPVWFWPQELPQTDYEYAIAARIAAGYPRTAASFDGRALPASDAAWAGLDLFVISNPKVLKDAAVVESLRRYVVSGGRLWIMLDLVPCELVRRLLEPQQLCEEIERVELNDFVVEPVGFANQFSQEDRRVISDSDIPMVRVIQEGGRVRFTVEGWPAAIEMSLGYGQLVLTTIESRAFIEPRTTQTGQDPRFHSAYQPRAWAKYFSVDANASKPVLPLTEQVAYPLEHFGNPVVPRPWVAAVLLGFGACLLGLGVWLAYIGKLAWMGIAAPTTTVLLSLVLVGAANWIRRDMPESLARFQVVDVSRDGRSALVREQAAVYLASSASMNLSSAHDGFVRVSEAIDSGSTRYDQEDFQKWKVANEVWPPGSWRYAANYSLPTDRLVVRATLSKAGLHLQLPENLPSTLEDPVLSFLTGDPMLCDRASSGLDANNNIKVEGDRWIAGTILSSEQQRRLEIYRSFFQADNQLQRPLRRLFGWTRPWEGASWNRELTLLGSALVALPVVLERPDVGSEVFIPHGLIKLQRNLNNTTVTSTFDDRTGQWRKEVSAAAEADMQFVLPPEVNPLRLSAIDLELDITAPEREVSVCVRTRSGIVELVKLESPSMPWKSTIANQDVLDAATDGILNVLIKVSESRDKDGNGMASNMIRWQIDHFHASVRGTVQPKSRLSSSTP